METAGQQTVAALAGVQPVHAPGGALGDPGVFGEVQMNALVTRGHRMDDGVHGAHPAGQRTRQRRGQPQHPARIGQTGRQHHGSVGAQRTVRPVQRVRDPLDGEGRAQGVVRPDDQGGEARPERAGRGELPLGQLGRQRAAARQVHQLHAARPLAQCPGEQGRPAAPAAAGYRVPEPLGQRIAERDKADRGRETAAARRLLRYHRPLGTHRHHPPSGPAADGEDAAATGLPSGAGASCAARKASTAGCQP